MAVSCIVIDMACETGPKSRHYNNTFNYFSRGTTIFTWYSTSQWDWSIISVIHFWWVPRQLTFVTLWTQQRLWFFCVLSHTALVIISIFLFEQNQFVRMSMCKLENMYMIVCINSLFHFFPAAVYISSHNRSTSPCRSSVHVSPEAVYISPQQQYTCLSRSSVHRSSISVHLSPAAVYISLQQQCTSPSRSRVHLSPTAGYLSLQKQCTSLSSSSVHLSPAAVYISPKQQCTSLSSSRTIILLGSFLIYPETVCLCFLPQVWADPITQAVKIIGIDDTESAIEKNRSPRSP